MLWNFHQSDCNLYLLHLSWDLVFYLTLLYGFFSLIISLFSTLILDRWAFLIVHTVLLNISSVRLWLYVVVWAFSKFLYPWSYSSFVISTLVNFLASNPSKFFFLLQKFCGNYIIILWRFLMRFANDWFVLSPFNCIIFFGLLVSVVKFEFKKKK